MSSYLCVFYIVVLFFITYRLFFLYLLIHLGVVFEVSPNLYSKKPIYVSLMRCPSGNEDLYGEHKCENTQSLSCTPALHNCAPHCDAES